MTTSKHKIKNATAIPATKARVAKGTAKALPRKAKPAAKLAGTAMPAPAARGGSKTAKILDLLQQPGGVTLRDLAKATGWQPNSVRGFLRGMVGKMSTTVEFFKITDGDRSP